jgi:hypothetical protein
MTNNDIQNNVQKTKNCTTRKIKIRAFFITTLLTHLYMYVVVSILLLYGEQLHDGIVTLRVEVKLIQFPATFY